MRTDTNPILIWGDTPLAIWLADKLHTKHSTSLSALDNLPDLLFLVCPIWQTAEAMMSLRSVLPFDQSPPIIVSLQMGIGAADRINVLFGEGHAMSGLISNRDGGGIILQSDHPAQAQVADVLTRAGLNVTFGSVEQIGWSSVFWGIQANALSTILNIDPADIYRDPALWAIEYAQLWEALGIIQRLGVSLIPLGKVNVPLMARQIRWLLPRFLATWLARHPRPPSLKDDLPAKRSDAAYLNGAVAYAADKMGLRTPINHALAMTVTDIAEGRALWSQYQGNRKLLETVIRLARG